MKNSLLRLLPLGLLAALLMPGALRAQDLLDTTFANPNLSANVAALAVQSDGKILVGGSFRTAGSGNSTYGYLARFNADGTLDTDFANPNLDSGVNALAVQSDGRILVAGAFTTAGSGNSAYGRLARFNANGSLDTSFVNPQLNFIADALALQPDGRILVGGRFSTVGSPSRSSRGLARLNNDGSPDTGFADPNLNTVAGLALAVQSDGRILVAGAFTTAGSGNSAYGRLARFNANGTLDTGFANPNLDSGVNALAVQSDGRILVAGAFTTAGAGSSSYKRLARFNADGTLDTGFADPNLNAGGFGLAVQSDGKILVGGGFTMAGSGNSAHGRLARFNANGSLDTSFGDPRIDNSVFALATLTDGKVLVAGAFTSVGSGVTTYGHLARFFTPPTISSVTPPAAGGYRTGAVLSFNVAFNLPVAVSTVSGVPQLNLTVGSTARQASYVSGSGGTTLTFTYTVQAGENDSDGISVGTLDLNGGAIVGSGSGFTAVLTFTPPNTSGVLVDTVPPTVVSVVRLNPGPQLLAVGTRQVVFRVTYSEAVQNVIPAGFSIMNVNGGTVTGTIGTPTGGPTVYDVPVTITGGAGEFRLRVNQ